MDTRSKLLTADQALHLVRRLGREGQPPKLVAGCFDPLLAAHARRLAGVRKGAAILIVIVTDPPQPVLPARARAELVAALAVVDHVVVAGEQPLEAFFDGAEVLRSEAEDLEIAGKLIQHVHQRQRTL